MELWHNYKKFCNVTFSPGRFVIGLFSFLAIINAIVLLQSLNWVECNKCSKCPPYKCANTNQTKCENVQTKEQTSFDNKAYVILFQNCNSFISISHFRTLMMLSFYVGYFVSHTLGCLMVKRCGAKQIAVIDVILCAIFSFISPIAIYHCGAKGIIVIRFLMGLSEGSFFPAVIGCTSCQFQSNYRNSMEGTWLRSTGYVAILLINLTSAILVPIMRWSDRVCYILVAYAAFWFLCSFAIILERSLPLFNCHPGSSSSYSSFDGGTFSWYSPTILSLLALIFHHEWIQSLVMTEVQRVIDNIRDSSIWSGYSKCWKIFLPFIMSWLLTMVAETLGNIMVMTNILNTMEARNLMEIVASFGPKICSDFVTCLMSTESNDILTACNCALSVLSTHYMGFKVNSLDVNNEYAMTFMNFANDIESIMTVMSPYMEELSREEVIE